MRQTSDDHDQGNTYFMAHENAAELKRLLIQDGLITQAMGGLFPAEIQVEPGSHILDLACGPGGWLLEVARHYHESGIVGVGVDIDQEMVRYARGLAESQELDNVTFQEMNIEQLPLPFPDNSFDIVNARLIAFFRPEFWPKLVKELRRILRPGGTLRLCETEMSVSNNVAVEEWHEWFFQALASAGQSYSRNGHRLTITAMLAPLLRREGFDSVQVQATGIDWSFGTQGHHIMLENMRIGAKLIEPFFRAQGIQQEDLERNYTQMMTEILQEDFAAVMYYLSAWGTKPAER